MQQQIDGSPQVYVAVLPPVSPGPGLVAAAAKAIGKSPAATRLLLAGRIPRIVAGSGNRTEAESVVAGLRFLGLNALTFSAGELRFPAHVFAAHALKIGDSGVDFLDRAGGSTRMFSVDASLVIRGVADSREEVQRTKTRMKLNLPATLLTGGIPIRRKTTEKTVEISTSTEAFLRIYNRKSPPDCVQIRQHDFDYACLGPDMGPASLTNFSRLVEKIGVAFSRATHDDRLTKAFTVDVPSTTPWEKVDIACRLILLFIGS